MKGMMLSGRGQRQKDGQDERERDDLLTSNVSLVKLLVNELIITLLFINRLVMYAGAHNRHTLPIRHHDYIYPFN